MSSEWQEWEQETHEGKTWWVKRLPSGAIIRSEIVEPHTHEALDSPEMALLKKIADKLEVVY